MSSSQENNSVVASSPNSKAKKKKRKQSQEQRDLKLKNKVRAALVAACGSVNRVVPFYGTKKRYAVSCPMPLCKHSSTSIKRHLTKKDHSWTLDEASIFYSAMVRKFQHARLERKSGCPKPYPCLQCWKYYDRLDIHLKETHFYDSKMIKQKIAEAKRYDNEKLYVPQFIRPAFFGIKPVAEQASASGSASSAPGPSSSFSSPVLSSDPLLSLPSPVAGSSEAPSANQCTSVENKELNTESVLDSDFDSLEHLVSSSYVLTEEKRLLFQLDKDAFHFYYQSADELFRDFEKWLVVANNNTWSQAKIYKNAVVEILTCCDSTLTLHPNALTNSNVLEDRYFSLHFKKIQLNSKLSELDQTKAMSCHTLYNRLVSLCLLFRFSEARNVYFGLSHEAIRRLRCKVDELRKVLRPFRSLRRSLVKRRKSINIINVSLLTEYGKSAYVRDLVESIRKASLPLTRDNAVSLRNHLLLSVTVINSLRKSNIALLNIRDYMAAEKSECGYCIVQERYKTAYKYGAKNILVPNDLKVLIDIYLLRYRDLLVNDSHYMAADTKTVLELSDCYRPLFPSVRANKDEGVTLGATRVPVYQMGSSAITSSLTSCFRKSQVNIPMKRLTPTCIRGSIATYFANNSKEDRERFATLYMKHSRHTMDSFYVSQWNAAEELRFALGIGQSFGVIESLTVEKSERPPKEEKDVMDWLRTNAEEYGFHDVEDIFEEDSDSGSDSEECAATFGCTTVVPFSPAVENNAPLEDSNEHVVDFLCEPSSTPVSSVPSEQTIAGPVLELSSALAQLVPNEQAVCMDVDQTLAVPVGTACSPLALTLFPDEPDFIEHHAQLSPVYFSEQVVAKPVSAAPAQQVAFSPSKEVFSVLLETVSNVASQQDNLMAVTRVFHAPPEAALLEPALLEPALLEPAHKQVVAKPVHVAPSLQVVFNPSKEVFSVPLAPNLVARQQTMAKPSLFLSAVPVQQAGTVLEKQPSPGAVQSVGSLFSQSLACTSREVKDPRRKKIKLEMPSFTQEHIGSTQPRTKENKAEVSQCQLDEIVEKLNACPGHNEWFNTRSFPRCAALVLAYILQDVFTDVSSSCSYKDYLGILANHSSDKLIHVLQKYSYRSHIKDKIKNMKLKIQKEGSLEKFVQYGNIVRPFM